jgi:uncharacterized protein (DUF608 family)
MRLQILFFLFILAQISQAQQTDPSHGIPIKKDLSAAWKSSLWQIQRRVYKGQELTTIGMPCGGIAAGQLYVRGDGTLANWWIANNAYNTGYGLDSLMNFKTALGPWKVCYQTFEPFSYLDQGFEISVKQHSHTITRRLNKQDFDGISFIGEYPLAYIDYSSSAHPLPLEIKSTVFSPFIPMNARESATPGTILRYTLKNTSGEKMQVSLTGWLQNLICIDLKDKVVGRLHNKVIRADGMVSVSMDLVKEEHPVVIPRVSEVFENFESGSYGQWKSEGNAFGRGPVKNEDAIKDEVTGQGGNYLVNSKLTSYGDSGTGKLVSPSFTIHQDYINFKLGGGSYGGRICINLVIDDKVIKSATGVSDDHLDDVSWDTRNLKGQSAHFEIVDNETGSWGHISVDDIEFSNEPAHEKFFPDKHPYFGNIALSVLDGGAFADADYNGNPQKEERVQEMSKPSGEKLTGATGVTIDLAPGETREISFLLTWYFPNRPLEYGNGSNWNGPTPTVGPAIGNMYANWFDNSLDVANWLHKNIERLGRETLAFHDAYYQNSTLPYWLIQRLMMPVSTLATETCQWWATDKFWAWEGVGSCEGTCTHVWNYEQALAHLFPQLERNIREKTDFGTSFGEDGGIQARNGKGGILIDGHAGAILKAYREHLLSKDGLFLSRNWSKIRKATEFIIKEDENGDGLIEKKQANTYDIAFYGANTYVGGLYLASLKAASQMAMFMKDTAFAQHCDSISGSGGRHSVEKLWNGEYFIQDVDLRKHPLSQYVTGCLSDQLFGQTWADLYGLGYLYPEQKVKTALGSIWKYNWATDVGSQTNLHKPERVYANPGESGLLICTWPHSKHMGDSGVRYRDEVWTGIEYQVATSLIYEGMIEEGLSMVKGVHDRYSPEKHNPWNEIECGDHYARAMASWGVLLALEDFQFDGPAKSLRFAPRVQPAHFKGFFTAAEGWGNIGQERASGKQSNSVTVSYGKLRLTTLEVETTGMPKNIKLMKGDRIIPFTRQLRDNQLRLNFDETEIDAGGSLKLSMQM